MGGGLLQLVAYGAQDVYLTGNPQITFFKVVYRRHTNFSMEAIEQTFSGQPSFGSSVYCQISRNGDLINRTYVEVVLPYLSSYAYGTATDCSRYVNYVGLRLLKSVTIEIGGQQIDKHYSDWLYIWNELTLPPGKKDGWNYMVGADSDITSSIETAYGITDTVNPETRVGKKLCIPLEFWFCRNVGLALPLIALQYHEVKIKIEFESLNNCVYKLSNNAFDSTTTTAAISSQSDITALSKLNVKLWVDYIFLDTDERRRFAQLSHEYLIEQLQFTGTETLNIGANRIKLNFNHPVKELLWVAKLNSSTAINQWYNYSLSYTSPSIYANPSTATVFGTPAVPTGSGTIYAPNPYSTPSDSPYQSVFDTKESSGMLDFDYNVVSGILPNRDNAVNPFSSCLLQLNGNDRFAERIGNYFSYIQPFQHHTNVPSNKGINVYSFSLKPEDHQPSGSLNMSRIDTAVLSLNTPNISASGNVLIYAVNYNVLRILSGMGGLAYSN
jgi:hypothetical protein